MSRLRFEDIPDAASATISDGFTDCVGVIAAGYHEDVTRIVARSVAAPESLSELLHPDCHVQPSDKALVLGTAAHALDFDDTGLSGHPSAVLVPAILANACDTKPSGRDMIRAYVAGYEIWSELITRDQDAPHSKGWHPSGVFGTIAAAAASASMLGLAARETTHAIGIAASLSSGLISNFGSMTKPFHLGRAAQSGIIAARLARLGMTAAEDAIEHDLGLLRAISRRGAVDTKRAATLGQRWAIQHNGLNIKLYPMCYGTHRPLDAMIALATEHDLSASAISSVNVLIGDAQAGVLRHHRPQTVLDAKFSIEFAMAAAVIARRCGSAELSDSFVRRSDVQSFFERVETTITTERSIEEPTLAAFDQVTVVLADQRRVQSPPVRFPNGHFKSPADRELLLQKFSDCLGPRVAPSRIESLFAQLQSLQNLSDASGLYAGLDGVRLT